MNRWAKFLIILLFVVAAGLVMVNSALNFHEWADWTQEDTTETDITATRDAGGRAATLLSAFFGLDSHAPLITRWVICPDAPGSDGMPVVFSHELDRETIQAGDFRVTRASGSTGQVACATLSPAHDTGEWRTVLLIGEYGSIGDQPLRVEVVGNILSRDHSVNFKGTTVDVIPLEAGPAIVLVDVVPDAEMKIGQAATRLPWGGGDGCPEGSAMALRVTWEGGVTKPGGAEVDDLERAAYAVRFQDREGTVPPDALADLGDGDNNHLLCFDTIGVPAEVAFPAGLMTDPREDLNPATNYIVEP